MKNKKIIMISSQSWDTENESICKHIAKELSKTNQVLFINVPLDRKSYFGWKFNRAQLRRISVLRGKTNGLFQVNKNLWSFYPSTILESINSINSKGVFDFFNRINNKRMAREIKKATRQLGFDQFILINDSAMFSGLHLKELLNPELFIYYIRDNLIAQKYFQKHGERTEPELIKSADFVLTSSVFLQEYGKQFNPNVNYIGHSWSPILFHHEILNELTKLRPTG